MNIKALPIPLNPRAARVAAACVALLAALTLTLHGAAPAGAQQADDCAPIDLGVLGESGQDSVRADGRWTTADCGSRFRTDADAHTYRFEIVEGGRVRIDLTSAEADSFLYLLAEDGRRLADNDDGGAGLDARVERDLTPGVYLVEAATVGGRSRGPADFRLSVSRVVGCEPIHLGALRPGQDLTASGSWTLDACGSRFVVEHPAHAYLFDLPQGGRVRIDLTSENGDPVLSLVSTSAGLIAANDDGGERRNSRIERYLEPGVYMLEATTYRERDYQPLMADFNLVVRLVDEKARQDSFLLKIEEVHTPERVIAGQPFPVHYRVGNLGRGGLADVGGNAVIYVVGARVFERVPPIAASDTRWQAGASYHTGAPTASAASVSIAEIAPFEVTLGDHGPSWMFIGVVTYDEDDEERGFHGLWHNLTALSGFVFDAVSVQVGGAEYEVSAVADEEGEVTVSVAAVADPETEPDDETRAKAVYAAGVRAQRLDGLFQRPALADLPTDAQPAPVSVAGPSSDALLRLFGADYARAAVASGLTASLARGEAVNPIVVEDLLVGMADTAGARYAALAPSWRGLQERVEDGAALSFTEARALHAQLAYAEGVAAPAVASGDAVDAARAAAEGWDGAAVQEMLGRLAEQAACAGTGAALRGALESAGAANVERLLDLDAEMRAALPAYASAVDAALCGALAADAGAAAFLEHLGIDDSAEALGVAGVAPPPETEPAPPPHRIRVVARLAADGRVEHGVEFADGEIVLPTRRYLPADSPAGLWRVSSAVEVDGASIGVVRTRLLADGRVELAFALADGERIAPAIRYLPAALPPGVWLRSGEFDAPPPPAPE